MLQVCGFQLEALPKLGEGLDRSVMRELLRLSPRERIDYNAKSATNTERLLGRSLKWDPMRILRTLEQRAVQYVLIGGQAAIVSGSATVTTDIDICIEPSETNHKRLVSALQELGGPAAGIRNGHRLTFDTDFGTVDCVESPRGIWQYDKLKATAERADLGGLSVDVASLEDVILMKRAAGQPKDLIEVEVLGALREELEAADE